MRKLLFDFFPVALFFLVYKLYEDPHQGILAATAVAIAASLAQVGWLRVRRRPIETMHLVTLALIVVLGGLTLWLNDERFIKWKPTLVNWLFGIVFLGSQVVGPRPLVQRLMEGAVRLPRPVWRRLNLAWSAFFLFLGGANLYVAFSFDTDTWVEFKMFGLLGLTVVFVLGQSLLIARHVTEPAQATDAPGPLPGPDSPAAGAPEPGRGEATPPRKQLP